MIHILIHQLILSESKMLNILQNYKNTLKFKLIIYIASDVFPCVYLSYIFHILSALIYNLIYIDQLQTFSTL